MRTVSIPSFRCHSAVADTLETNRSSRGCALTEDNALSGLKYFNIIRLAGCTERLHLNKNSRSTNLLGDVNPQRMRPQKSWTPDSKTRVNGGSGHRVEVVGRNFCVIWSVYYGQLTPSWTAGRSTEDLRESQELRGSGPRE